MRVGILVAMFFVPTVRRLISLYRFADLLRGNFRIDQRALCIAIKKIWKRLGLIQIKRIRLDDLGSTRFTRSANFKIYFINLFQNLLIQFII